MVGMEQPLSHAQSYRDPIEQVPCYTTAVRGGAGGGGLRRRARRAVSRDCFRGAQKSCQQEVRPLCFGEWWGLVGKCFCVHAGPRRRRGRRPRDIGGAARAPAGRRRRRCAHGPGPTRVPARARAWRRPLSRGAKARWREWNGQTKKGAGSWQSARAPRPRPAFYGRAAAVIGGLGGEGRRTGRRGAPDRRRCDATGRARRQGHTLQRWGRAHCGCPWAGRDDAFRSRQGACGRQVRLWACRARQGRGRAPSAHHRARAPAAGRLPARRPPVSVRTQQTRGPNRARRRARDHRKVGAALKTSSASTGRPPKKGPPAPLPCRMGGFGRRRASRAPTRHIGRAEAPRLLHGAGRQSGPPHRLGTQGRGVWR
jgi:hypothetical protein